MGTEFEKLAKDVTEYIGVVQPELEQLDKLRKQASVKEAADREFVKRATETLGTLARSGVLSRTEANQLVDAVSCDHAKAWDVVTKVAEAFKPVDLGDKSEEKTASAAPQDPWEREFGGYTTSADNGMID